MNRSCTTCTARLVADELLDALSAEPEPERGLNWRYAIPQVTLQDLPVIRFTFSPVFPRDVQ